MATCATIHFGDFRKTTCKKHPRCNRTEKTDLVGSVASITMRRMGPVTYIGRNLSLLVYVLHIAVLNFIILALRGLHVDQTFLVRWTLPIMVVILTLLVAFVLDAAWRRITRG